MADGQTETQTDVKWFGRKSDNASSTIPNPEVIQAEENGRDSGRDVTDLSIHRVPFNRHDLYYNMSGDKLLLIFNHRKYEKTVYFRNSRPLERMYTDRDVTSLNNTFSNLGFKTVVVRHDLKHIEIIQEIKEVCKMDHRGTSCIAIAIMTHGDEESVFASDRPYYLSDVTKLLQNEPSLVGKPKLLFIQACRGDEMDDGQRVQTDGRPAGIILPTHADTLIMLASSEKHLAYRDSNGSWLMQSLCQVLDERHKDMDLLHMITLVNQLVAYRETYTTSEATKNKKMMPETKFTLTKLIKFD